LTAFNNNTLVGQPVQISDGWMRSTSTAERYDGHALGVLGGDPVESLVYRSWFPYSVFDQSAQNAKTFEIGPTKVNYSRVVSVGIKKAHQPLYQLQVSGGVHATALYNRSLTNHSLVYKERGTSEEVTDLRAGAQEASSCFSKKLTAANGYTISRHNTTETCDWRAVPLGFYTCGLAFCAQLDGTGRSAESFLHGGQHVAQGAQRITSQRAIFV